MNLKIKIKDLARLGKSLVVIEITNKKFSFCISHFDNDTIHPAFHELTLRGRHLVHHPRYRCC